MAEITPPEGAVRVRFLRRVAPYNAGETAGVAPAQAARLTAMGAAKPVPAAEPPAPRRARTPKPALPGLIKEH